jgi:hypothetical protein
VEQYRLIQFAGDGQNQASESLKRSLTRGDNHLVGVVRLELRKSSSLN